MTDYRNDPRVTCIGDDEYRIAVGREPWRVYRDGNRWFSECPEGIPFREGPLVFEHPSEEEAFKSMLNPSGGLVVVPAGRLGSD